MDDTDFRQILNQEWEKRRPRIPMGERRIELAIACMRRAYEAGRSLQKAEVVRGKLQAS